MPNQPMIQVSNISKGFGDRLVLEDISLTVAPNEILAIVGPSGCGKSTLLRVISGLDTPDKGAIELADQNLTMVFQYSALFDSLTVFENVAFSLLETPDNGEAPVSQSKKPYTQVELHQIVSKTLQLVGLGDIEDLYPNQLSGGMQKRVSFARAIVSNPRIVLYDEPTAGLDPIASTVIENYIATLRDEIQVTSIVVTHNLSTIRHIADRVCLLFNGKIQWEGTSKSFFETDNPYARQFAESSLDGPMTAIAH